MQAILVADERRSFAIIQYESPDAWNSFFMPEDTVGFSPGRGRMSDFRSSSLREFTELQIFRIDGKSNPDLIFNLTDSLVILSFVEILGVSFVLLYVGRLVL